MVKTCLKALFKLCVLFIILFTCLFFTSEFLRPSEEGVKDSTEIKVDGFYALNKQSINVLFMGTSHTYFGFNPAILWKETGLTSTVFAGQCQPIELTYTYLKEALKTQSPELVVLDIFALAKQSNVCQTEGNYRVNIQNLKFNKNKAEAYALLENQSVLENMFDVSLFHDRLTQKDGLVIKNPFETPFDENFGYSMGYMKNMVTWDRPIIEVDEVIQPDERRMAYLKKIIQLCKENNIQLLLVKTPYYMDDDDAKMYKAVWDEVKKEGIKTLDFNAKLNEIDYIFDMDGDSWHSNAQGAMKITTALSQFIMDEFTFENSYTDYNEKYEDLYSRTLANILFQQYTFSDLRKNVDAMDVTVLINYDKKGAISLKKDESKQFGTMGIDFSQNNQSIIYRQGEFEILNSDLELEIDNKVIQLTTSGDLFVEGAWIDDQTTSLKFVIIDNRTGEILDNIQFEFYDQIYILRR